ncbi:YlzJ-like family protein [Alkalicoccobacillus murimartini]|uniref:Uncharacterized protein n=1 Tax=Alkalicoccobacillus murimartini TaxID=171685 RepID=A0ABT9YEM5_9BACI|nr:YlzJ-like family protein [Alkalicoccobacillus murimartini]MDQ0206285.1 hypothetical protein [Alkalicoccobacillus murimartini]
MILYTMMPLEEVYPEESDAFSQQMSIPIGSGQLIVEPFETGKYKVVRLVCGDSSLYLDPRFSPGAIIDANPLI